MRSKEKLIKVFTVLVLAFAALNLSFAAMDNAVTHSELKPDIFQCFPHHPPATPSEIFKILAQIDMFRKIFRRMPSGLNSKNLFGLSEFKSRPLHLNLRGGNPSNFDTEKHEFAASEHEKTRINFWFLFALFVFIRG